MEGQQERLAQLLFGGTASATSSGIFGGKAGGELFGSSLGTSGGIFPCEQSSDFRTSSTFGQTVQSVSSVVGLARSPSSQNSVFGGSGAFSTTSLFGGGASAQTGHCSALWPGTLWRGLS